MWIEPAQILIYSSGSGIVHHGNRFIKYRFFFNVYYSVFFWPLVMIYSNYPNEFHMFKLMEKTLLVPDRYRHKTWAEVSQSVWVCASWINSPSLSYWSSLNLMEREKSLSILKTLSLLFITQKDEKTLPCLLLTSWGWGPGAKCSSLYVISGVSGWTAWDGCTTGTLLDCGEKKRF